MAVTVHEINAILALQDKLTGPFKAVVDNLKAGGSEISNSFRQSGSAIEQELGYRGTRALGQLGAALTTAQREVKNLKDAIAKEGSGSAYFELLHTQLVDAEGDVTRLKGALKELNAPPPTGGGGGLNEWLEKGTELLGAFGVAMSAEAVISFGRDLLESTAQLSDMSRATGVSAENLQRLGYVGVEAGVGVEQISRAVETFSTKLANGDKNATSAVQSLGLSVKDLLAQGPMDAFLDFAEAAGRIEDPMTKGGVAAEALGARLSKQLLPMLGDLRTKMEEVPQKAIISDENVKAAKDFDDAISHGVTTIKAWVANTVGAVGSAVEFNEQMMKAIFSHTAEANAMRDTNSGIVTLIAGHRELGGAQAATIANTDIAANKIKALRAEAMEPLTDEVKAQILELKKYNQSEEDIAKDVQSNVVAVHLFITAHTEAEAAIKKTAAAQATLKKALDDAASSMEDLSGDQVEAIRWYHEHQTSVSEIAKTLEVYPHQVQQIIAADAEWKQSSKALEDSQHSLDMVFAASAKKINDEWKAAWKKLVEDAEGGQESIARAVLGNNKVLLDANAKLAQANASIDRESYGKQLAAIDEWVRKSKALLNEHGDNFKLAADKVDEAGRRMREALKLDQQVKNLHELGAAFSSVASIVDGLASSATGSFASISHDISQTMGGISQGLSAVGQYYAATTNIGRAAALANAANAVIHGASGHTSLGGAIIGGAVSGASTAGALTAMNPYAIAGGAVVGAIAGIMQYQQQSAAQLSDIQHSISLLSTVRTSELSNFHQTRPAPTPGSRGTAFSPPDPQFVIGLAAIAHNADIAGVSLDHLRDAYNSHDADAYATAINDINDALQRHNNSVKLAADGLSRYTSVVSTAGANLAAGRSNVASITQALIAQQTNTHPGDTPDQIARNQQQVRDLEQQLHDAQAAVDREQHIVDALGLSSVHAADAIAGAAVATWGQMLRSGTPVLQIVQQMAPTLATLDGQLNAMGASGGAAFQRIKNMAALAQDDIGGPVIEAVDGLGQTLRGLNDVGGLTQEQFSGTTEQITTMFHRLVDGGADSDAALGDMQPALQTIWELVHDNHMEVDAQTGALLHQAEAAGIVGETHKDIQHQMLDALNRTADSVQILSNLFLHGLPDALGASSLSAQNLKSDINNIPSKKDIEVHTSFTTTGNPNSRGGANVGNNDHPNGTEEAAGGSGFAVGERWFHTNGNEWYAFGGEDGQPIGGDNRGGGGSVSVQIDGREIARAVLPLLPDELYRRGVRA